jgi:hypothetical protein
MRPPLVPAAYECGPLPDTAIWRRPSGRVLDGTNVGPIVHDAVATAYQPSVSGRRNVPSAGGSYGGAVLVCSVDNDTVLFEHGGPGRPLPQLAEKPDLADLIFSQAPSAVLVFFLHHVRPLVERYGARGYRYALLEAGHFGQELLRELNERGLEARPYGSFDDGGVVNKFGLALSDLLPLYCIAAGSAGARKAVAC